LTVVRIPGYAFDSRLYQSETTTVLAGCREADGAPVVGKRVQGGARVLQEELSRLQRVAGVGVVEALGIADSDEGPVLLERRFGDQNLAQAIQGGPLPVSRALRIGLGIARGLARIHASRIVHRDIKPDNVLLDSQHDAVVIADFGSAAELPEHARTLPVSDITGTPSYVSPEQTGRMGAGCDFRSDLYSLGVTLYELVTGTLPFESTELIELVSCHLSKVPELPDARVPSVPNVLSAIIMKLLGKSPAARYQSAQGLAADLERCLATLSADGSIPNFELGLSDRLRPRVPERSLGREKEYAALCDGLERAKRGTPTLVAVSGAAGSGRRELAAALLDENPQAFAAIGGWTRAG
jgi:serine/threonine protein kinase